ncbi:TrmH family RNA methyltransferase [Treponema sp. HNW]|uniref:TrmH family RNA methyltransferase n=1 Tax=Treponema sp. HNW TaxID=3116654 RepID=UPI003D1370C7
MIDPSKLHQMHGGFRRRKLVLTLGALERDIAGLNDETQPLSKTAFKYITRADYIKKIARIVAEDPKMSGNARNELIRLIGEEPFDERRVCNTARNYLLEITGSPSAEWDLIIAPHSRCSERPFHRGLFVYAEDIRSPFNLGSVFRTAEAFGAEKLFLSPFCTDPAHPRAIRSAMGCMDFLPHERLSLDELRAVMPEIPVFALETGGTPLEQFEFPARGIAVIGSEELGIHPETLKKASYGTVSIPVCGVKASLNVGVAFGILMQSWTAALKKRP